MTDHFTPSDTLYGIGDNLSSNDLRKGWSLAVKMFYHFFLLLKQTSQAHGPFTSAQRCLAIPPDVRSVANTLPIAIPHQRKCWTVALIGGVTVEHPSSCWGNGAAAYVTGVPTRLSWMRKRKPYTFITSPIRCINIRSPGQAIQLISKKTGLWKAHGCWY